MRVIEQSDSYILKSRRQLLWGSRLMVLIMVVGFLVGVVAPVFIFPWSNVLVALVCALFYIFAVYKNTDRRALYHQLQSFTKGIDGEKQVRALLEHNLNNEYTYLPNYVIPKSFVGDIDGLLIGPKGVIIIEVKNWVGSFFVQSGNIYRKYRHNTPLSNPFVQVLRQAEALESFLTANQQSVSVRKLIVLVNGKLSIEGKTGVYITQLGQLLDYISKITPIQNANSQSAALLDVLTQAPTRQSVAVTV